MNKILDDIATEVIMKMPAGAGDGDWYVPDEFIDEFGILIVNMCADIVEDLKDLRVPASEYADKIKEHFGIKK